MLKILSKGNIVNDSITSEEQKQAQQLEQLTNLQRSGLERLVFSGGGAKGVAYSGVYRALVDTGAMQNVKEIAGSSVGSVAATLIAVGLSPDEMRGVFDRDLTALLGERVGSLLSSNSAGTRFFSRSTERGYFMVRDQVIFSITTYLDEIKDDKALIDSNPELASILAKVTKINGKFPVRTLEDGSEVIEYPIITFADLDMLHKIAPDRFKKLLMTATKHPSCELQIFSAETTPDVEIALAVCASCCIPGFFSPVSIPGFSNNLWVDGGVHDNMPESYFDRDESGQYFNKKKAQTLLFAFVEGSSPDDNYVFDAIHHNSKPYEVTWIEWLMLDIVMMFLANLTPQFSVGDRHVESYQRMREEYALRTIQLNTSSIGALSFANATLSSRVLFALGYFDTTTHLFNQELFGQSTCPELYAQILYEDVLSHFEPIYRAILSGAGWNLEDDALLNQLNAKNADGSLKWKCAERLDLIKTKVLEDVYAPAAFALSRSLELYLGQLEPEKLFKEAYEESFRHSARFAASQICGETILSANSLHQSLEGRSMFALYHEQSKTALEERLFNVFNELNELPAFKQAYTEYVPPAETAEQNPPAYYNLRMIGLFMAALGAAAVAVAFVAINAATLVLSGAVLAIAGGVSLLVGCGLFKEAQNETASVPLFNASPVYN